MAKKITTKEYKNQIKDKPVICLEKYQGTRTSILHRCLVCDNEWKVRPNGIKRGRGCPNCAKKRITLTTEEYKNQIKDLSIVCLGEYQGALTKILHQCKICNTEWSTRPSSIKSETGCPSCNKKRKDTLNTTTTEQYKKQIKDLPIISLENYQGSQTKILHQCLKCNHKWQARPHNIKSGSGCPSCNEITTEQYKNQIIDRSLVCLEEYQKSNVKILHQCQVCNHRWKVNPHSVKSGSGCPSCNEITTEKYREQIYDLPIICLGEYKKAITPILHQCRECNHKWNAKPNNIKSGNGCPNCNNLRTNYDIYKNQPTWLYYIFIPALQIWKIGVVQDKNGGTKGRYKNETFYYHIIKEKLYKDGYEAYKMEQEIINSNREHKWKPTSKQKFIGWTECFICDIRK